MLEKCLDWIAYLCMPLVTFYHLVSTCVFLNFAAQDASLLEATGNRLLMPLQYLFAGQLALPQADGHYEFQQRFDYHEHLVLHTAGALATSPFSLTLGAALKGLAFLSVDVRERHQRIVHSLSSAYVGSQAEYYQAIGLPAYQSSESVPSQGYARNMDELELLAPEKEALKAISALLKEHGICFWVDAGTCLGVFRYGGMIPWDGDIDIAVLQPDFHNVYRALRALDRAKYAIQDWSNRLVPQSYLRVYVRETRNYIDIYHFAIDEEASQARYILSHYENSFMPASWKVREGRFQIPTPYAVIFPLKCAQFDGIEVPIPNQIETYLKMRYGENLAPAKILNPTTGKYENDPTHPYWQIPYAK